MRPSPRMPSVHSSICFTPQISLRMRSHASASMGLSKKTRGRMASHSRLSTYSTTAWVLASGVDTTATPRSRHACRSMLSSPTPARPTTFRDGSDRTSAWSTRVSVRTTRPCTRGAWETKVALPGDACTTSHWLRSQVMAAGDRVSVTATRGCMPAKVAPETRFGAFRTCKCLPWGGGKPKWDHRRHLSAYRTMQPHRRNRETE